MGRYAWQSIVRKLKHSRFVENFAANSFADIRTFGGGCGIWAWLGLLSIVLACFY